uniref:Uncharacterized protein n=1 Tax=Lactuca sativa TaxID=4236 RepID=A0A9R1XVX1_LACSA|nr:hypothetical protein LSAT_V11C100001960 [Lactuca sativa]
MGWDYSDFIKQSINKSVFSGREIEDVTVDFTEGEDNNRERMLRDIGKVKACSEGVVHPKLSHWDRSSKKKDVKAYINKHAVETKRDLHFGKMTEQGLGLSVVLVSKPKDKDDWVVNTLVNEHRCVQSRTIKTCNYKFIATNIMKQIESIPTILSNALQEDLIQKFEMNMSRMKVHRAKALAQKNVFGDFQKQYAILRDYGLDLMERNPCTCWISVEARNYIWYVLDPVMHGPFGLPSPKQLDRMIYEESHKSPIPEGSLDCLRPKLSIRFLIETLAAQRSDICDSKFQEKKIQAILEEVII